MLLRPVFGVFSGEFPILYLAAVFIYAGAVKALDPVQFASDIDNYKILPWPVSVALAFYLPWLEILCALGLVFRFLYRGALSVWSASIVIFTLATKVRALDITCGCFGHASQHWSFPSHLATNLAIGPSNNSASLDSRTRWIVFVAAPGVEILDLVGPLQVFARASEMHSRGESWIGSDLFGRSRDHFLGTVAR